MCFWYPGVGREIPAAPARERVSRLDVGGDGGGGSGGGVGGWEG